jgi:hypothetical protein
VVETAKSPRSRIVAELRQAQRSARSLLTLCVCRSSSGVLRMAQQPHITTRRREGAREVRPRKGLAVTVSPRILPAQLVSTQPWLRDQYAALRSDVVPLWHHTRAVVVPVLYGASSKVRNEIAPVAARLSSQLTSQALDRSAPLRSELSNRSAAALAAARGQITAAQIAQLNRARSHRKLWLTGAAAVASAILGAAVVLWQRSQCHKHDWVESESTNARFDDGRPAGSPEQSTTHDSGNSSIKDAQAGQ